MVPTLAGGYLPWLGVPTLAGGYPTLAGGYLPCGGGGVPTLARGIYLGWEYLPWLVGTPPWLGGIYLVGGGGTYLGWGVPTLARMGYAPPPHVNRHL